MNLKTIAAVSALFSLAIAAPAFASPDLYLVNFRHADDAKSQRLAGQLPDVVRMAEVRAEEVVIDTTTAAKWEKAAHDAFNKDIVPVFNKWVGLPGFVAVVDADSKNVIGCLSPAADATVMARELRKMASMASGRAFKTTASTGSVSTQCPDTFNIPPTR
ncbi:MAG: hypothetical protein AAF311_16165 [Pseudomonadota bacterium]